MPRRRVPKYQHHKPRNIGRVLVDGKLIYLRGEYNSPESLAHYEQVVSEVIAKPEQRPDLINVTLARLALLYVKDAATYYVKDGKPTPENGQIKAALKPLLAKYKSLPVSQFGPLKLRQIREAMIAKGWVRSTVNDHISRINRMLAWGVENEMVPPHVSDACKAVRNLQKGRSSAPEGSGVKPVNATDVAAVPPCAGPFHGNSRGVLTFVSAEITATCGFRYSSG